MTNPTTPFSWQMPTSTDLVTDLPADFETFGQAVATSMADLLGGTTGQVLSKASNTDMDFTWVAQDDSNAIQNAIVDAKGDLIAATAADTPARLAVGTNGQVLTADSTAATGLAWATASSGSTNVAGKNGVLNSNFSVWQRNTTFTLGTTNTYTADRWLAVRAATVAGMTVSRQVTGDTTNLPFIQYCARVQRESGNTSTNALYFGQPFETVNSIPFAGKTVTFSFYARKGANYSATSSILKALLSTGTGTDQNVITGSYTGNVSLINQNATLTTTWQRFSFSATVAATATELTTWFESSPTGTAGTNDWYEITGVQLEIASSASAYSPATPTQQAELAACQRYYLLLASGTNKAITMGYYQAAGDFRMTTEYPTVMRTVPTLSTTSGSNYYRIAYLNDDVDGLGLLGFGLENERVAGLYVSSGTISGTAGTASMIQTNNASAFLGLQAEL